MCRYCSSLVWVFPHFFGPLLGPSRADSSLKLPSRQGTNPYWWPPYNVNYRVNLTLQMPLKHVIEQDFSCTRGLGRAFWPLRSNLSTRPSEDVHGSWCSRHNWLSDQALRLNERVLSDPFLSLLNSSRPESEWLSPWRPIWARVFSHRDARKWMSWGFHFQDEPRG